MLQAEPTITPGINLLVVARISGGFTNVQRRTHTCPSNYPASGGKDFRRLHKCPKSNPQLPQQLPYTGGKDFSLVHNETHNDPNNYPILVGRIWVLVEFLIKKIYIIYFFKYHVSTSTRILPTSIG